MIELANKKNCTGCSACLNACPKSAISMIEDTEGFLQPSINPNKCIECGLCQRVCPVLNPIQDEGLNQKVYAFINYTDRTVSSSGGAFSFFARKILSEGGIVFGATMDENLNVYHIGIEDIHDLYKLRGSKYVQSKIGMSYKNARNALLAGRKVLFCGTPCQIAGLYKFLGKRWENTLLTLDLVCHGVPNQQIFNTYLEKLAKTKKFSQEKNGKFIDFRFRNLDSWSIVPAIKTTKSKTWYILSQEHNVYMTAFFRGLIYRESCFKCQFASTKRIGTFTIADFWGVGTTGKKFRKNVSAGVSMIIDNFGQMDQYISLSDHIYIEERTIDEAKLKNENLNHPIKRPKERNTAIHDILSPETPLSKFAKQYDMLDSFPKHLIKTIFKNLIYGLGLYNVYKTISYKLGRTS